MGEQLDHKSRIVEALVTTARRAANRPAREGPNSDTTPEKRHRVRRAVTTVVALRFPMATALIGELRRRH